VGWGGKQKVRKRGEDRWLWGKVWEGGLGVKKAAGKERGGPERGKGYKDGKYQGERKRGKSMKSSG